MTEKSDLLEKQASMLQLGADSSNRSFALQQEVAQNLSIAEKSASLLILAL
jgi:hypothetical protein